MAESDTRHGRAIRTITENRFLFPIFFVGIIIVALATFTNAVDGLIQFSIKYWPSSTSAQKPTRDGNTKSFDPPTPSTNSISTSSDAHILPNSTAVSPDDFSSINNEQWGHSNMSSSPKETTSAPSIVASSQPPTNIAKPTIEPGRAFASNRPQKPTALPKSNSSFYTGEPAASKLSSTPARLFNPEKAAKPSTPHLTLSPHQQSNTKPPAVTTLHPDQPRGPSTSATILGTAGSPIPTAEHRPEPVTRNGTSPTKPKTAPQRNTTNPATNTTHESDERIPHSRPIDVEQTPETGQQIRAEVRLLIRAVGNETGNARVQSVAFALLPLPADLNGDEIKAILGSEKWSSREALLRLALLKTKRDSLDPDSIPGILGQENWSTKRDMLEKLLPFIKKPIPVQSVLTIYGSETDCDRARLLSLLSKHITRPLSEKDIELLLRTITGSCRAAAIGLLFIEGHSPISPAPQEQSRQLGEKERRERDNPFDLPF